MPSRSTGVSPAPRTQDKEKLITQRFISVQRSIARFPPLFRRIFLLLLASLFSLVLYSHYSGSRSPRIPFHYPLGPPEGNLTFSPIPTQQIPPYVHFVYALSPSAPFGFLQFVCLSSALHVLEPEIIYWHHVYPMKGWWWDRWVKEVERTGKTRLELIKERNVTEIFGNEVEHFAHKADVLRLEALRDYGGIYLDVDVLVIKDFSPLYSHSMVMGMESQPNLDPNLPPSGLCNAIMLSKPFSSFVVRWLETYRTFDKTKWAKHSVTTPWNLAKQFPHEITVLNKFAFFWPLWHDDHLRLVHRYPPSQHSFHSRPSKLSPTSDSQFAYHLWESAAGERYLGSYDPDRIHNKGARYGKDREEDGLNEENAFSREARKWVSLELRKEWREAKLQGLVD